MQMMCAYEVCSFPVQVCGHTSLINAARLLLSDIPSSASSSLSKSGKDSITRMNRGLICYSAPR